ncbi:hypothetical protein RB200_41395 [Streptomyces sp. PmtG]
MAAFVAPQSTRWSGTVGHHAGRCATGTAAVLVVLGAAAAVMGGADASSVTMQAARPTLRAVLAYVMRTPCVSQVRT